MKKQKIALAAPTVNTAIVDTFNLIVTPGISVISELVPGKMKTRSAKKVTTVLPALYFQLGVPRPSTGLAPVLEMSHTANLVKLDTTASIMTVYLVYVLKVTSVPKRQRSQFHAGKDFTTLTRDRERIPIA